MELEVKLEVELEVGMGMVPMTVTLPVSVFCCKTFFNYEIPETRSAWFTPGPLSELCWSRKHRTQ